MPDPSAKRETMWGQALVIIISICVVTGCLALGRAIYYQSESCAAEARHYLSLPLPISEEDKIISVRARRFGNTIYLVQDAGGQYWEVCRHARAEPTRTKLLTE